MQSRLAVIRCKSFQKTRNNLICSRRKHCQGGENISPTSSLKSSTFPSQNQNLSNLGKTRREYLSPTLNSFHTGVIATRKVSTYHRYVQTSSAPKSPASTLIKPSRSSSAAAAASSLRTSTTEDEVDFFLDSATANITNEAHSSSLYNEVLSNEDDILKFTNENIQRLLHEELQSIENGMQSNEHMSAMDDGMINIDIQQNLKENQMEQQQSKSLQNEQQKTTMAQLLQKFDLQKPPSPEDTPLEEIQHWFEFAAQQESVQKYEDVVQNARDREDYASLSIVQRHMLQWYGPLRERIVEEQEAYYGKKTKTRTANKYGPLLCLLQPEKLAILTMHEATMFSLKKGGSSATLCQIAMKISDAVEAEFNVQRLLKTRMDQGKISMSKLVANDNDENTEIEGSNSVVDISNDERSTKSLDDEEAKETEKKKKDVGNDWMYGPSHLQRFMDELNRADPGRKGKVRLQRANRRARRLLDSSESWSSSDKITLGVVLMKLLMETATVDLNGKNKRNRNNGNDVDYGEPAFVHEKIWMNDNNLVGCIKINEDFYRMVVEDKFSSLDAFTTRHKPMVLPPRDWTSPNDGGYMVLDTDFMRTKGCQIQKARWFF
jgi:DNA-directed RNA polymerase